jgi:exonuclease III
MDLADVYRIFHPTSAQYTFFSVAHGPFSKTDHILGHKASLSKYKKIEIIPCILSDHNAVKLELNNNNNSKICK